MLMDDGTVNLISLSSYAALMIIIPLLLWGVARLFSPKKPNPIKNAPFECAQVSVGNAHELASISYFPFAIIYAIFGAFAVLLIIIAPYMIHYPAGLEFIIIMLAIMTIALMSAAISLRQVGRRK